MKFWLKKTYLLIKSNFKVILLILFLFATIIFSTREKILSLYELIKTTRDNSKKEVNILENLHTLEREKKKLIAEKYVKTVESVEEKYNIRGEKLAKKQKKMIKEIVETWQDEPDELNKALEDLYGIKPY